MMLRVTRRKSCALLWQDFVGTMTVLKRIRAILSCHLSLPFFSSEVFRSRTSFGMIGSKTRHGQLSWQLLSSSPPSAPFLRCPPTNATHSLLKSVLNRKRFRFMRRLEALVLALARGLGLVLDRVMRSRETKIYGHSLFPKPLKRQSRLSFTSRQSFEARRPKSFMCPHKTTTPKMSSAFSGKPTGTPRLRGTIIHLVAADLAFVPTVPSFPRRSQLWEQATGSIYAKSLQMSS